MIDIESRKFKTIVEATTSGLLSEVEAAEMLNTTPQKYRAAVDEFLLSLQDKTIIIKKPKKKEEPNKLDTDILITDFEEGISNETIRCRKRRKVETCKECLWYKENCPHLANERKNKNVRY